MRDARHPSLSGGGAGFSHHAPGPFLVYHSPRGFLLSIRTVAELEAEALKILQQAISRYGPRSVYSMLSGGNDSRTVTTVATNHLRGVWTYRGAALIDTGIGLREAHESTTKFAMALDVELTVVRTPQDYATLVRKYGFPGPAQHTMMYRNLKERAVRVLTRMGKVARRDKVMLVSGVRQNESVRRMLLTDPVTVDGARVWVNPLFYWTTPERDAYMEAHGIERNPISGKICGTSGDCCCGCNAEEGELGDLDFWFGEDPSVLLIHSLRDECKALGVPSEWGHKPNGNPARKRREGRPMFLCVGCEAKADARI